MLVATNICRDKTVVPIKIVCRDKMILVAATANDREPRLLVLRLNCPFSSRMAVCPTEPAMEWKSAVCPTEPQWSENRPCAQQNQQWSENRLCAQQNQKWNEKQLRAQQNQQWSEKRLRAQLFHSGCLSPGPAVFLGFRFPCKKRPAVLLEAAVGGEEITDGLQFVAWWSDWRETIVA